MALNYKRIPYRTQWVEFQDIGEVGKAIGAPPTTPIPDGSGNMLWTVPMLVDPNHLNVEGKPTVLSDSANIVKYLEDAYPERKVIPEGTEALHRAWRDVIYQNITSKVAMIVVPLCPDVLSPRAKEYFVSTREAWSGGPLKDFCPDHAKAWEDLKEGLSKVAVALDANGVDGEVHLRVIPGKVTYADFLMVAPLLFGVTLISKEELEALRGWNNGRWGKVLDVHVGLLRIQ